MKNNSGFSETTETFLARMQNLQNLLSRISRLESRLTNMVSIMESGHKNSNSKSNFLSNIIPFPGNARYKTNDFRLESFPVLAPYSADPGKILPLEIPDFRPFLQRDGLILLSWDKRITESGELYSAYWVTSSGAPRFYASKPLSGKEFTAAHPDHKSYAAEDGIEFYGQKAPRYMVYVAPELMMSNPRHRELRQAHIEKLKLEGSSVDFNYKFLLKTEKDRSLLRNKSTEDHHHRAG